MNSNIPLPKALTVLAHTDNQSVSVGFFSRVVDRYVEVLTVGDRDCDLPGRPGAHTVAVADAVVARYNAYESLLKTVDSLEADAINLHCALQSTAHMDPNDNRIAVITGQVVRDLLAMRAKAHAAVQAAK